MWTWEEDRFGNITVIRPDGKSIYLQGDDVAFLKRQINRVHGIWANPPKNGIKGPFASEDEHCSAILDQYSVIEEHNWE